MGEQHDNLKAQAKVLQGLVDNIQEAETPEDALDYAMLLVDELELFLRDVSYMSEEHQKWEYEGYVS